MGVITLNEQNFHTEIASGVVLVDFWAEWCGPCQIMLPILSDFEIDMGNKIKVAKVNIDDNSDIASSFDIMSVPTLILFKDGKVVETIIGVRQKEELKTIVGKYL